MDNKIEVSVIIPTYNGGKKISNALDALLKQSFKAFEVIVVIDGSTDNTFKMLERFSSSFAQIKIITQSNQGRSAVRNRGVKEAISDLVIFYDDDMVPELDSVVRHVEFHHQHFGLLCGNQFEIPSSGKTDIQNYKAFLSMEWTKKYKNDVNRLDSSNLFFTAANASVKKDLFYFLGGFDENLTDAEDHDLAHRALNKNIPVFFDKKNRAVHNDLITCKSYIQRQRLYASAHEKLKKNHPERYAVRQKKNFLKRLIYKIFAQAFWVRLIDSDFFARVLPQKVRYKLYDIVIQALGVEYPYVTI
jgi:glycosyltransferase involved in cell wall biosynthesis